MVGTKVDENGNEVPNCVPEEDADEANLAEGCPDGQYLIGDECISIEDAEDPESPPPSALSEARVMQQSALATEPIEREELGDDTVAYRNLKLLDEGVWTDQRSKTPTLYASEHFSNYEPVYDSSEYDGPPVNIMHDLNEETDQANPASVAGHVDPNSLRQSGSGLFGDVVLDLSEPAGEYADENLQSALESNGKEGFGGPSVELNPTRMRESDHREAQEEVVSAELSGLGLVMEPASKSVAFEHETRQRQVALGDSQATKQFYHKRTLMDIDKLREALDMGDDLDEMTDDEVVDIAEAVKEDLDEAMDEEAEMGDYSDSDMEDMEGDEDEEEEEEDMDMEEHEMQDMEEVMSMLNEMQERLETIETEHEQLMNSTADKEELAELNEELTDAKEELAAAETVAELQDAKDELDKRLSELEEEPDTKTLADSDTFEFEPEYEGKTSQTPW
jgi:hypothetical protein